MILLKDPDTGRFQQNPVHMNRLKMAYVRRPNPSPYFLDHVISNTNDTVPTRSHTLQPLAVMTPVIFPTLAPV